MPILQDPEQRFPKSTELRPPSLSNNATIISSKESISTQVCDGPMPDASASWDMVQKEVVSLRKDGSDYSRSEVCTSDRNELMERIKRGESPTWIPSQTVSPTRSRSNGPMALGQSFLRITDLK